VVAAPEQRDSVDVGRGKPRPYKRRTLRLGV
jgi:hypothetical protein